MRDNTNTHKRITYNNRSNLDKDRLYSSYRQIESLKDELGLNDSNPFDKVETCCPTGWMVKSKKRKNDSKKVIFLHYSGANVQIKPHTTFNENLYYVDTTFELDDGELDWEDALNKAEEFMGQYINLNSILKTSNVAKTKIDDNGGIDIDYYSNDVITYKAAMKTLEEGVELPKGYIEDALITPEEDGIEIDTINRLYR